jgi:hypothetical protein
MKPFLCYLYNTYPELAPLMGRLDATARCVLEGRSSELLPDDLEHFAADIQDFLLTRDGRFLPQDVQEIDCRGLLNNPLVIQGG